MSVPVAFRAELSSHNRHAVTVVFVSFVGAVIAWNAAYFIFVFVLLGFLSAIHGDFGSETPAWTPRIALAFGAMLLVWGLIDAFRSRFVRVSDRLIIGWHLIPDILLLPVRVTFAIWGNLSAIRRLSPVELDRAWELLTTILQAGQAKMNTLRVFEPDPAKLHRLLSTLQLLGYIDLHAGKNDWFYTVCSQREPELRALAAGWPRELRL